MGSIARKSEAETVAQNIMKILARNGNSFRLLSWEEYVNERQKDGNFSEKERPFFVEVVRYCATAQEAAAFCPAWAEVATGFAD
jgi:hypothetical protein